MPVGTWRDVGTVPDGRPSAGAWAVSPKWTFKQLFFLLLSYLGVNAIFRQINKGTIKTLLYHNVLDSTNSFPCSLRLGEFEAQLKLIKRNFASVKVDQNGNFIGLSEDRVNVLITFDDCYINNYEIVFPLLVKHGLSACFFVVTNQLEFGKCPQIGDGLIGSQFKTISVAQAREMTACGMTFGAHSLNHDDYLRLSYESGLADARTAKEQLSRLVGEETCLFAFPSGRSWPGQADELTADFKRIFTTRHGFNRPNDQVFNRNEVASTLHFEAAASGSLDFFDRLMRACRVRRTSDHDT